MSREVFRLRYQWPAREPGEPEVGYPGGDLIEGEWNPPVTRHLWSKSAVKDKVYRVLHPRDPVMKEPGRIVSIERAAVSDWSPASDLMDYVATVAGEPLEEETA